MKKYWKFILLGLVGIAIWLFIPHLIGVEEALRSLKGAKWPYLLLAILFELVSYAGVAALSRRILGGLETSLKYRLALKLGFLNAFAIHVLPVGALGASSLDYYFLKRFGVKGSKIVLLIVVRTITIYLGLFTLLILSSIFARMGNLLSVNQQFFLYSALFLGALILSYLAYLYLHTPLYFRRIGQISAWIKRIVSKIQGEDYQSRSLDNLGQDLYQSAQLLFSSRKNLFIPLLFALIYWLGDVFCLYFALLSLGYEANMAILIFGYVVGYILSNISFIPGGVGILEITLSLIYIGFGMPAAPATLGVLVYRLFSFWLIIPVGAVSFVSLSKKTKDTTLGQGNNPVSKTI